MDWRLLAFGAVVGFLVGLTGMGGGVLMTPLLMLGFGLPPAAAVGTDLAYASDTKLAGAWQHWRQGTVDGALVRDLALGSLPASLIAVRILAWLRAQYAALGELWLGRAIAVVLLLVALLMLQRIFAGETTRERTGSGSRTGSRPWPGVIAVGALGGFLVGLTSVGSGSVIMALLALATPLSAHQLVGTDVVHAALLVSVAALSHLTLGDTDLRLVGQLLIGSIPGVLLGSWLMPKAPRRGL